MQSLQNETKLIEESRILKQQLSQEIQKLEQAQSNQKQNETTLKELNSSIAEVKKEIEAVEDRDAVLKNEIQTLQNDKQDLQNDLRTREERERERLVPEIEIMQKKIQEQKASKLNNEQAIKIKERENEHLEEYIEKLKVQASKKEENEKLSTEYLNVKNDPDRWAKKKKSFENEVGVLKKQVETIKESIAKLDAKKKK